MSIAFAASALMFCNIVVVGCYYFSNLSICPWLVRHGYIKSFPELPGHVYLDQGRRIQWGVVFVAVGLSIRLGVWLPATYVMAIGEEFSRITDPMLQSIYLVALIPYVHGCALHLYPRLSWHFGKSWWIVPVALNTAFFIAFYYFVEAFK